MPTPTPLLPAETATFEAVDGRVRRPYLGAYPTPAQDPQTAPQPLPAAPDDGIREE